MIIASAVVLVVAAVAVVIVYRHAGTKSPTASPPPTIAQRLPPAPQSSAVATTTTTTTATAPTTTTAATTTTDLTTPTTAEASAETELGQLVASDHSAVEQLVGSWVPELSAKKIGMVVNGAAVDYQSILADYQQQSAAHPGALLLQSGDYSNFKLTGFFVTLAPQPFTDPSGANSWCDTQHIDAGDCYAVRIMHTGGYQGNAVFRG